jgi:schlafen family protein
MPWEPITTFAQLRARLAESSMFDLKATYDTTKTSTRYDIAKDVAAFATAFGGTIVVGVQESGGKAIALPGVSDRPTLMREIATALQGYCSPLPATPEEHEIIVTPENAVHLLGPGVQPPHADVTLLTLNVRADPRGPIGVRPFGANGPTQDTYKFPIRVNDQTAFLGPTELPMWMNSHERKVALQLAKIPVGKLVDVELHCRRGYLQQGPYERNVSIARVDEEGMYVVIEDATLQLRTNVPFGFIAAVWEKEDGGWAVAAQGHILTASSSSRRPNHFVPYLGGA